MAAGKNKTFRNRMWRKWKKMTKYRKYLCRQLHNEPPVTLPLVVFLMKIIRIAKVIQKGELHKFKNFVFFKFCFLQFCFPLVFSLLGPMITALSVRCIVLWKVFTPVCWASPSWICRFKYLLAFSSGLELETALTLLTVPLSVTEKEASTEIWLTFSSRISWKLRIQK